MYELRLIKKEGIREETIASLDVNSPNVVMIGKGESRPMVKRLFDTLRVDEKHEYRQIYCEIAKKLVDMYKDYIGYVSVERIGFLVDDYWTPTEKSTQKTRIKIEIEKAGKETQAYLGFQYIVKLKDHDLDVWDEAQVAAAILSQLLRIDSKDGSIKKYSEEYVSLMVSTFGIGYLDEGVKIENPIETQIQLLNFPKANHANGQMSIDDLGNEESEE